MAPNVPTQCRVQDLALNVQFDIAIIFVEINEYYQHDVKIQSSADILSKASVRMLTQEL